MRGLYHRLFGNSNRRKLFFAAAILPPNLRHIVRYKRGRRKAQYCYSLYMRLVVVPHKKTARSHAKPIRRAGRGFMLLGLLCFTLLAVLYFRPLPAATVAMQPLSVPEPKTPSITWASSGDSMVSAEGYSFTASNHGSEPLSTASIAKVITVLCVLEKLPLSPGEQGPVYTMTANDVALYQHELMQDGTNLPIVEGEELTEYQMIQAIMLPSANNIANSLAIRTFGSIDQYRVYASNWLERQALRETVIGPDASGYDPATKSSYNDLVKLAKIALKHPVLMEIAGSSQAQFATAGTVYNRNQSLSDGVLTGLKTGRNELNSGSFLFTAVVQNPVKRIALAGVVANAGDSAFAAQQANVLAKSMSDDFDTVLLATKGQTVGTVETAWGARSDIIVEDNAEIVRWTADKIYVANEVKATTGVDVHKLGTLSIRSGGQKDDSTLLLKTPIPEPSVWWRLTHIR